MEERKEQENSILAISIGFLLLYFYLDIDALLYLTLVLSFLFLVSDFAAKWIHKIWMGIANALGYVNSRIILGTIFILILTPIALVYRLLGQNTLNLKRKESTYYEVRNHSYESKDLENPW